MIYAIQCKHNGCGTLNQFVTFDEPVRRLFERAKAVGWQVELNSSGFSTGQWLCPFHATKPASGFDPGTWVDDITGKIQQLVREVHARPEAPAVVECGYPTCRNVCRVEHPIEARRHGWSEGPNLLYYCPACWKTTQMDPRPEAPPTPAPLQCAGEGCGNQCAVATYKEAVAMGWAQVPMIGDMFLCKNCHDDMIKKMVGTPHLADEPTTYEYWANEVKAIAAQVMHDKLKEMLPRAANLAGISGVEQPALTYLQMAMVECFYPDPEGATDARPVRGPASPDAARDKNPGNGDGPGGDRSGHAGDPDRPPEGYPF